MAGGRLHKISLLALPFYLYPGTCAASLEARRNFYVYIPLWRLAPSTSHNPGFKERQSRWRKVGDAHILLTDDGGNF